MSGSESNLVSGITFKSIQRGFGWPLLILFFTLILSSTGAQLHGRLLLLGDWFFGEYYLIRADLPAPTCEANPNIEERLQTLEAEAEQSSGLDALFEEDAFDRELARKSLEKSRDLCREKHLMHAASAERITPAVKAFRVLEQGVEFFTLLVFDYQRAFIIILLFLGAICSTLSQHHISFRPVRTLFEHRLSHGVELAAILGFFLPSAYAFVFAESGQVSNSGVQQFEWLILAGVIVLAISSCARLLLPPASISEGSSESQVKNLPLVKKLMSALLTIPIYVYMMVIAGYYFTAVEGHTTGISIYTGQLFQQADMFLQVGLYIWLGMMLKRSRLGHQLFDVLRPWGLSPEMLALLAVILMAVPTAYTGASGIIIIAMGAIVYKELCQSGARRSLALAATAMTGSAGVVLRPCLIIVIIAALNKDVVTSDLYSWGTKVFALTAFILFLFLFLTGNRKLQINSWQEVRSPFLKALSALKAPAFLFAGMTLFYYFVLDAKLDEISAPIILPVIMLVILWYETRQNKSEKTSSAPDEKFGRRIYGATQEAAVHIGALLMLMAFSFTVGGVIERTEIVTLLPEAFQSVWVCMAMLVVLLVFIGMVMDPFGAVVLVSGSIAAVAYNNGIAPLHFWMVTLVAFELGYLSPPVALNHLLTRQVIGEDEAQKAAIEASSASSFWFRHERILLPMCVMAMTLLITAFVPLML